MMSVPARKGEEGGTASESKLLASEIEKSQKKAGRKANKIEENGLKEAELMRKFLISNEGDGNDLVFKGGKRLEQTPPKVRGWERLLDNEGEEVIGNSVAEGRGKMEGESETNDVEHKGAADMSEFAHSLKSDVWGTEATMRAHDKNMEGDRTEMSEGDAEEKGNKNEEVESESSDAKGAVDTAEIDVRRM